MIADLEDYQRYLMIVAPQEESIETDSTLNPIFAKYPDIFLQQITRQTTDGAEDFLIANENESLGTSDLELQQVRLFEGFICTLDQIEHYKSTAKVKPE